MNKKESIWVMWSLYIMNLHYNQRFTSIFGTVVEVKPMSTNDKYNKQDYELSIETKLRERELPKIQEKEHSPILPSDF